MATTTETTCPTPNPGDAVFYRGPGRRHGSIGNIGPDIVTHKGITYVDIEFHESDGRLVTMLAVPTMNVEAI